MAFTCWRGSVKCLQNKYWSEKSGPHALKEAKETTVESTSGPLQCEAEFRDDSIGDAMELEAGDNPSSVAETPVNVEKVPRWCSLFLLPSSFFSSFGSGTSASMSAYTNMREGRCSFCIKMK